MNQQYFISVIMPIRNEAEGIRKTLLSLLSQDYPNEKFEIIVADGMSDDGTIEIVKSLIERHPSIVLIENTKKIVPTGLNKAIQISKGEVILRVDAHSYYPSNYISRLVEALDQYQADNVGCLIETVPYDASIGCKAIAIALSSPFGVGNSSFRVGVDAAMEVDTVPFGCFRREVFDELGLFDEDLVRNQDDEFNARMRKFGRKIVLIPDLKCSYTARKDLSQLRRMMYQYGLFKPLVNSKLKQVSSLRQLVPLLLVLFTITGVFASFLHPIVVALFISGMATYISAIVLVSLYQAIRHPSKLIVWFRLLLTYPSMHYAYGWGYVVGLKRLVFRKRKLDEFTISR